MRQQCFVAYQLDRTGALLWAFKRGEQWAVNALSRMGDIDFFVSLFALPEYNGEPSALLE